MEIKKYTTTISRERLANQDFVPEQITLLDTIDECDQKRYYQPVVELLKKMYDEALSEKVA